MALVEEEAFKTMLKSIFFGKSVAHVFRIKCVLTRNKLINFCLMVDLVFIGLYRKFSIESNKP